MFEMDTKRIADKIKKDRTIVKNIYGIPRGGLIIAVKFSHLLGKSMITDERQITPLTLVVDDISDEGKTLLKYRNNIIATLHYVKSSLVKPDYFARFKDIDDWVEYPWESFEKIQRKSGKVSKQPKDI